jgi:hypothetical protein
VPAPRAIVAAAALPARILAKTAPFTPILVRRPGREWETERAPSASTVCGTVNDASDARSLGHSPGTASSFTRIGLTPAVRFTRIGLSPRSKACLTRRGAGPTLPV